MTQTTAIPDATAGPKVNVALVQIRVAPPDDVQGQCAHMRELVLKAVKEGKDKGKPVNIAVLPVSTTTLWVRADSVGNVEHPDSKDCSRGHS